MFCICACAIALELASKNLLCNIYFVPHYAYFLIRKHHSLVIFNITSKNNYRHLILTKLVFCLLTNQRLHGIGIMFTYHAKLSFTSNLYFKMS